MERDTLILRLTVTPAAWHILGDDEPAFATAVLRSPCLTWRRHTAAAKSFTVGS